MRKRGYLGWATAAVAWVVAACALTAAPGCGDSGAVAQAQFDTPPRESLRDSLKYSQALHQKQKPSKRSTARR
ncbi:hypothetical protein [Paludisphaera mucosa]|uniref:Secreted protein n=1 Tax=Paludisphaera mucosa TaxID=3030827 RepID=A0ABT6FJD3_9BACT|nr:hypothetical protein [Paludisphaera mucosa]MDG3007468.1 hypothetical protein [Paludisphaera mucosa]